VTRILLVLKIIFNYKWLRMNVKGHGKKGDDPGWRSRLLYHKKGLSEKYLSVVSTPRMWGVETAKSLIYWQEAVQTFFLDGLLPWVNQDNAYPFLFLLYTSKNTAASSTRPLITCCQSMLIPMIDMPLFITPMMKAPTMAPMTVPMPPEADAPPI
jgi:hypothetical protein